MRANRLLVVATAVVALAVVAIGAVWFLSEREDDGVAEQASSPQQGYASAAAALSQQGASEIEFALVARMPEGLDDGVPRRRITGTGILGEGGDLASAEFEMSEVPNSAGYFGHVPGPMSVVYEGSNFLVTFPIMADALAEPFDWVRYDLEHLSQPSVIELGIGQLREIGLADPRLALALLRSPTAALSAETPAAAPATTGIATAIDTPTEDLGAGGSGDVVVVDPAQAATTAPVHLELLEEVAGMGVQPVEITPELDSEGGLQSLSYELAYPAEPNSTELVTLQVTIDFVETGAGDPVEAPPADVVQPYDDLVGL